MHGLSESKIITEHRCTTAATMRLEHKSSYLDLPDLSTRPRTPVETIKQQDTTKTVSTNTEITKSCTGSTQTPPIVPPKPCTAPETSSSSTYQNITTTSDNNTLSTENKSLSTSFAIIKQLESAPIINTESKQQELSDINLVPGSPPEICYVPKTESANTAANAQNISEKIRKIEEYQQTLKEAPQGGVPIYPPTSAQSYKHESTLTKQVKVEYGQPIIRAAATLPKPVQQVIRASSPKPSAEGVAMSRLWTPTPHLMGYDSSNNLSDVEQSYKSDTEIIKEFKPAAELHAPYLVKEATKSISIPTNLKPRHDNDIELVPGSPPEICFAPKVEVRRQSLVEAMEKTLEQNLLQGPSKVLPHSVPTLTPPSASPANTQKSGTYYKPPPPVVPSKIYNANNNSRHEYYESDYESDRNKYSGSESDANAVSGQESPYNYHTQKQAPAPLIQQQQQQQPFYHQTSKTSGYAADTEDHARNFYDNSVKYNPAHYVAAGPTPIYSYTSSNGHETREYSKENVYNRDEQVRSIFKQK